MKTLLIAVVSIFLCNVCAFAQSEVVSQEVIDSIVGYHDKRPRIGKTYISRVSYDKKDGKVSAFITIQYPYLPSSNGPFFSQSTVRKRLNTDGVSFYIVSRNMGVAVDKDKVFIRGMEKNEQEDSLVYENGRKRDALVIPLLTRTDYDLFDSDPATLKTIEDDYNFAYFKDKNHVYYIFDRISGADAESFEYVDERYAKDDKHVFYKNKLIENSDAETFEFFDYGFAKDANQVYFNGEALNMYDAPSFMVVAVFQNYYENDDDKQYYYLKDKNGVYINNEIIPSADPESFEMVYDLGDLDTLNMYAKDKNFVFAGKKILHGADPVTFEMDYDEDKDDYVYFDKNNFYKNGKKGKKVPRKKRNEKEHSTSGLMYSVDRRGNVYYWNDKIKGADSKSFELINREGYAKDKNHVYYGESPISDSPGTFDGDNLKDKQFVYYSGMKFTVADIETYVRLGSSYFGKDKIQGYYIDIPIEGSDAETLILIGMYNSPLAKDANHVYYKGKILEGANPDGKYEEYDRSRSSIIMGEHNVWYKHVSMNLNPKTFKREGFSHYKDDKKVLYNTIVLEDVDVETFVAFDVVYKEERLQYSDRRYRNTSRYGKDKNHVYYEGVRLPDSNVETFEFIDEFYAKDKNNVYYNGKIVEGADSETFRSMDKNGYRWMDKNDTFVYGEKVKSLFHQ